MKIFHYEIAGSLKNLKPEKISLRAKFNRYIHVLVIHKFGERNRSKKSSSALDSNDHPINTIQYNTIQYYKICFSYTCIYPAGNVLLLSPTIQIKKLLTFIL